MMLIQQQHLLNCPAKPTILTPINLLENPTQTATFLDLILVTPTLEPVKDVCRSSATATTTTTTTNSTKALSVT
jgi:hypothetical protein